MLMIALTLLMGNANAGMKRGKASASDTTPVSLYHNGEVAELDRQELVQTLHDLMHPSCEVNTSHVHRVNKHGLEEVILMPTEPTTTN